MWNLEQRREKLDLVAPCDVMHFLVALILHYDDDDDGIRCFSTRLYTQRERHTHACK